MREVYDPEAIEAAIGDCYAMAEMLGGYQEQTEEAIGIIEDFPYDFESGQIMEEDQAYVLDGMAKLGNLSFKPRMDIPVKDIIREAEEPEKDRDFYEQSKGYSAIINEIGRTMLEDVIEPTLKIYALEYNQENLPESPSPEDIAEQLCGDSEPYHRAFSAMRKFGTEKPRKTHDRR